MSLESFKRTGKGNRLADLFSSEEVVQSMIRKSQAGRPAVEAIGREVEQRVGDLDDQQKKLVGRWVKEILAPRGWRPDRKGRVARGHLFSRGTIYQRIHEPGVASNDAASRVARARALVARFSHPIMGSDELIAERRREFLKEIEGE
jgi:hypothetical protein